jgi:uncharacterized membrane protein
MKINILKESKIWVDDKIININQATQICEKYGIDYNNAYNDASKHKSSGYNALVFLGYLFIGIASIVLMSENWEEIPKMLRTFALITITFGINIYASLNYNSKPQKSTGLFFLGGLMYGVSIILIAQIYHLGEHMPDGIFWWAMGILPFAVITKNNYLMLLTFVLATIWFGVEFFEYDNTKLFYLIFVAFSIYGVIKYPQNILNFIVNLLVIPITLMIIFIENYNFKFGEYWVIFLGLLFLIFNFGFILQSLKDAKFQIYSTILKFIIIFVIVVNLMFLTYDYSWKDSKFISFHIIFSKDATLIAGILFLIGSSIASYYKKYSALLWGGLFVLTAILQLFIANIEPIHMQIIYNLVFVIFAISLIIIGINTFKSSYFFLGVSLILLFAFIRYIDLVGGYIGTSILFMVLAVIMLGSAKYWRVSFVK